MRVVHTMQRCLTHQRHQSEALAAFSNDQVYMESFWRSRAHRNTSFAIITATDSSRRTRLLAARSSSKSDESALRHHHEQRKHCDRCIALRDVDIAAPAR